MRCRFQRLAKERFPARLCMITKVRGVGTPRVVGGLRASTPLEGGREGGVCVWTGGVGECVVRFR